MRKSRFGLMAVVIAVGVSMGPDLSACGDKFLVAGRGTRYQRPKNARAASVLIYANPSSGLAAALKGAKAESALKSEGHRSTTVETPEQLSAVLAGGRFDVVLVSGSIAAGVEQLLGAAPDRAVVVAVDAKPKTRTLLEAIDKAVERRDQNARKIVARS